MTWNWEQPDWPKFSYDSYALESSEERFLLQAGEFMGVFKHIGADERIALRIELMCEEAVKTSEIEGQFLNRESVQSSLRREFGLGTEQPGVRPAERGIAKIMHRSYRRLFDWSL